MTKFKATIMERPYSDENRMDIQFYAESEEKAVEMLDWLVDFGNGKRRLRWGDIEEIDQDEMWREYDDCRRGYK